MDPIDLAFNCFFTFNICFVLVTFVFISYMSRYNDYIHGLVLAGGDVVAVDLQNTAGRLLNV